jgi:hypothetical protein
MVGEHRLGDALDAERWSQWVDGYGRGKQIGENLRVEILTLFAFYEECVLRRLPNLFGPDTSLYSHAVTTAPSEARRMR